MLPLTFINCEDLKYLDKDVTYYQLKRFQTLKSTYLLMIFDWFNFYTDFTYSNKVSCFLSFNKGLGTQNTSVLWMYVKLHFATSYSVWRANAYNLSIKQVWNCSPGFNYRAQQIDSDIYDVFILIVFIVLFFNLPSNYSNNF